VGIVDIEAEELQDITKPVGPMWMEITGEYTVGNLFLRPGDLIKCESVTPETIHQSIALLKKYIRFGEQTTISLFHLDIDELSQYDYETLDSFYSDFSH
jgi:hypothetical protein